MSHLPPPLLSTPALLRPALRMHQREVCVVLLCEYSVTHTPHIPTGRSTLWRSWEAVAAHRARRNICEAHCRIAQPIYYRCPKIRFAFFTSLQYLALCTSLKALSFATLLLLMGTSWPSLVSVLILLCCASTCVCWSSVGPISASGISAILAHLLVPSECSNLVLSHPRHMHDALWRCAVRHLRGVGGDRSGMSSCCKGQAATTMSEKGPQQFKRNAVVGVLGYLQLLPRGAGQVVSAYTHEHVCVFARVRVCAFVCSLSLPFSLSLSLCLLFSLTLSSPPLGHTYKHMQILIRLHLHRY